MVPWHLRGPPPLVGALSQAHQTKEQELAAAIAVQQKELAAMRNGKTAAAPAGSKMADASVTAPWRKTYAEVTALSQWQCSSCGRKHAAWHSECFPCARLTVKSSPSPPGQPPALELTVEDSATVTGIAATQAAALRAEVDDSSLDAPLEELMVKAQMAGPEVAGLISTLLTLPSTKETAPQAAQCALSKKKSRKQSQR